MTERARADGPVTARAMIRVRVQPNARRDEMTGFAGDTLRVRVAAPPQEGRANRAVVALLSHFLGVPASRVTIVRGHGSRQKLLAVEAMLPEEARRRLEDHIGKR